MTEAMLGYAEAAFIVLAIVLMLGIIISTFNPRRRKEMQDNARIPFHEEETRG